MPEPDLLPAEGKAHKGAAFFRFVSPLFFLPSLSSLPAHGLHRPGGARRRRHGGGCARRGGIGNCHLRPQGRGGERAASDPALRLHPLPQERPGGACRCSCPSDSLLEHAARLFPGMRAPWSPPALWVVSSWRVTLAWLAFGAQMWPDLIQKAKDGGLDVVQTYVFWNGHEPSPGKVVLEDRIAC